MNLFWKQSDFDLIILFSTFIWTLFYPMVNWLIHSSTRNITKIILEVGLSSRFIKGFSTIFSYFFISLFLIMSTIIFRILRVTFTTSTSLFILCWKYMFFFNIIIWSRINWIISGLQLLFLYFDMSEMLAWLRQGVFHMKY